MSEAVHRWKGRLAGGGRRQLDGTAQARRRAIVEVHRRLAAIDECYRPSTDEVASAAGVTPAEVRRAITTSSRTQRAAPNGRL